MLWVWWREGTLSQQTPARLLSEKQKLWFRFTLTVGRAGDSTCEYSIERVSDNSIKYISQRWRDFVLTFFGLLLLFLPETRLAASEFCRLNGPVAMAATEEIGTPVGWGGGWGRIAAALPSEVRRCATASCWRVILQLQKMYGKRKDKNTCWCYERKRKNEKVWER